MKLWHLISLLAAVMNLMSGAVFAQNSGTGSNAPQNKEVLEWVQLDLMQAELLQETLVSISEDNTSQIEALKRRLEKELQQQSELIETARGVAGDTNPRLQISLISGQFPNRATEIANLLDESQTPDLDDLRALWQVLESEVEQQKRVVRFKARAAAPGEEPKAETITRVGPFTAVADGKFLGYQPETGIFEILERQPSTKFRDSARDLESACEGCLVKVAIDPSSGAILGLIPKSRTNPFDIAYGVLFLSFIGAVFVAKAAETSRKARTQDASQRGYFWGYFFAIGSIIYALIMLVWSTWLVSNFVIKPQLMFPGAPTLFTPEDFQGLLFFHVGNIVLTTLAAWGTVNRNKYGFIFLTIISLAWPIWIINGIYTYRRWSELNGQPKFSIFKPKTGLDEPANAPTTT